MLKLTYYKILTVATVATSMSVFADPDIETINPDQPETIRLESFSMPEETVDCIFARSVHNWKALDDRNLIIWAPSRKKPYLVELSMPIHSLRFADSLALNSRDNRLCSYGGDAIIVQSGSFPERSTIREIYPLDESSLQGVLAKFDKSKKSKKKKSKE